MFLICGAENSKGFTNLQAAPQIHFVHYETHFTVASAALHPPFSSYEYTAGSLRPELGGAGGEEAEQLLHHRADVGG